MEIIYVNFVNKKVVLKTAQELHPELLKLVFAG